MSSTYSTSLRIQLIDTATEFEAWGQPTDNNLGTVIEQAITGIDSISLTNLTSYTLTTANAAVDQARNAVLIFTGSPTANCNVVAPSVQKIYIINNQTTGGYNVNIKTASGNAAIVNANSSQLVFCDGTTFYAGIALARVQGDLTVTGNIKIGGLLNANNGSLVMNANTSVVDMGYNNGAMIVPVGTTTERPSVGIAGMSRWNTSNVTYEIYNGFQWIAVPVSAAFNSYSINYLILAGGGGGGGTNNQGIPEFASEGGGGGAGGLLINTGYLVPGTTYTITVGTGGAGAPGGISPGVQGNGSSLVGGIVALYAIGGGGGSYGFYDQPVPGGGGGSGGGGGGTQEGTSGGAGVQGQGNNGGNGVTGTGGGGGGAGSVGASGSVGGAGGSGLSSSISGSAVTYATGGSIGTGAAGAQYLGNGGGGAYGSGAAGSGGSGIAIISYAGSQRGVGGTVTTSGGYTIHTFTSSGTYIAQEQLCLLHSHPL